MCAAVRADPSKSSFFAEKKSTTLADDHVKECFRLDSGPDGPKTKTTKIAGLAHLTRYSFWVGLLVMTLFFRFSSTIAAKALGVFYHFQWALAIGTRETAL